MSTPERIRDAVMPGLTALGLQVEDVNVTRVGKRRVVRILVDDDLSAVGDATSPVPSISLDAVADATRVVDEALESTDVMGDEPYTLEVSSPGVERPVSGYGGLRRNVGRLAELTLEPADAEPTLDPAEADGDAPARGERAVGRLRAVTRDEVTLQVSPEPARKGARPSRHAPREMTLPLTRVRSARVQVEFGRPSDDEPVAATDAHHEEN